MDANLLVTFEPTHSGKAQEEVKALLEKAGEKATFQKSDIDGVFLLKTKKNPKELVKAINTKENADNINFTFHWVPIDKWCPSGIADMAKVLKEIDAKMDPKDSWKMDLGKRHYDGDSTQLIMKLTENISKPNVDLKNPKKIVKVEIIGKNTGISLLDASEFLSSRKLKGK